jgi:hypothetical protein
MKVLNNDLDKVIVSTLRQTMDCVSVWRRLAGVAVLIMLAPTRLAMGEEPIVLSEDYGSWSPEGIVTFTDVDLKAWEIYIGDRGSLEIVSEGKNGIQEHDFDYLDIIDGYDGNDGISLAVRNSEVRDEYGYAILFDVRWFHMYGIYYGSPTSPKVVLEGDNLYVYYRYEFVMEDGELEFRRGAFLSGSDYDYGCSQVEPMEFISGTASGNGYISARCGMNVHEGFVMDPGLSPGTLTIEGGDVEPINFDGRLMLEATGKTDAAVDGSDQVAFRGNVNFGPEATADVFFCQRPAPDATIELLTLEGNVTGAEDMTVRICDDRGLMQAPPPSQGFKFVFAGGSLLAVGPDAEVPADAVKAKTKHCSAVEAWEWCNGGRPEAPRTE